MAEEQSLVRKGFGSRVAGACRGGARTLVFALALATGSCAPMHQAPLVVPANFEGPRFEGDKFISFDGAHLGLTVWKAEAPPPPPDALETTAAVPTDASANSS